MKQTIRHSFEFILIAVVLVFGLVVLNFVDSYQTRLGIIALLTLFYVVAGVWHHWEEKILHIKQVLEHFGIAALIFVVLSALYR